MGRLVSVFSSSSAIAVDSSGTLYVAVAGEGNYVSRNHAQTWTAIGSFIPPWSFEAFGPAVTSIVPAGSTGPSAAAAASTTKDPGPCSTDCSALVSVAVDAVYNENFDWTVNSAGYMDDGGKDWELPLVAELVTRVTANADAALREVVIRSVDGIDR